MHANEGCELFGGKQKRAKLMQEVAFFRKMPVSVGWEHLRATSHPAERKH